MMAGRLGTTSPEWLGRLPTGLTRSRLARVGTVRLPDSDEFAPPDDTELEEAYREMAADAEHEREAEEWCEALIGDATE
jgi:hypothetical protein